MIEMLGDLLRAIFGLITKGDLELAGKELNEAYLTLLRKDAGFFQQIPADKLTTTLLADHHYTHSHLEILAGLFYAEARLREAAGNTAGSREFYEKSLKLFMFTLDHDRTYSPERQEKIEWIRKRLSESRNMQT